MEKLFQAIRERSLKFIREAYGLMLTNNDIGVNLVETESGVALVRVFFRSVDFRRINISEGYFVANPEQIPDGQVWINVFTKSRPWYFIPSVIEFEHGGKRVVVDVIPHKLVVPIDRIVRR